MTIEQEVRRLLDRLAREVTAIARRCVMELFGGEQMLSVPRQIPSAKGKRRRERRSAAQRIRTAPEPMPIADLDSLAVSVLDFMEHNRSSKIGHREIVRALRLDANVGRAVLRHLVAARRIVLRGSGRGEYELADRANARSRRDQQRFAVTAQDDRTRLACTGEPNILQWRGAGPQGGDTDPSDGAE